MKFSFALVLLLASTMQCSPALAAVDPGVAGTWKVSIPSATGPIVLVWKIEVDGRYESWVENAPTVPHETGRIEASNGRYSVKRLTGTNAGKSDSGTYDVSDPSVMKMLASTGPSQWTRISDLPSSPTSSAAGEASIGANANGASSAATTSSPEAKPGKADFSKIKPLLNAAAGIAATAAAHRYIPNSVKRYVPSGATAGITPQGASSGIIPSGIPSFTGPGSLGNSPHIGYAQACERKGDWFNAANHYENAALGSGGEITKADMAAAAHNNTSYVEEMQKRMATDPNLREIQKRLAYCDCMLIKERLAGKPGNTDVNHTIFSLHRAYEYLILTDRDTAVWPYLDAVYWCCNTNTMEYNYRQAWVKLSNALSCKNISPALRTKIQTLRHHIFPAMMLQMKDLDRAKFDRMKGIVQNVEHPTIINYVDSSGNVVDTYDSRNTLDTSFYSLCKDMLAHDYPQFANDYNSFVRHVRSLPNKGIAVPPGNDEELSKYGIPQWEEKAFGPLDFRTGRL